MALALEWLQRGQNLIWGDLFHQNENGGATGLKLFGQLLHEVVIDPEIGEAPRQGAGPRPNGRTHEGHEKQHSDQHAPEATRYRPHGGEVRGLVEFDLSGGVLGHDDHVLHVDQILLLQLRQGRPQLEGGLLIRKRNNDKIAHLRVSGWSGCQKPMLIGVWGLKQFDDYPEWAKTYLEVRQRLGRLPLFEALRVTSQSTYRCRCTGLTSRAG